MAKKKRVEAPVGKGINKAALNASKNDGVYGFKTYKINENAWKAFYASEEGKVRLRIMRTLNDGKQKRYAAIAAGQSPWVGGTDKEIYEKWRNLPFDATGKLIQVQGQ